MSRLEVILSASLALSIIANLGLFIYARAAIVRLISVSDELADLQIMVNSFAHHLQSVYELDSFYGDETLRGLLDHAISFNEQMETFEYVISLTQQELDEPVEDINDNPHPEEEANPT
mgnify:FL=1|tara:strand:- start:1814 stop:2167 length:354 start_codon:yes stop_codon:yes gene_type:complete